MSENTKKTIRFNLIDVVIILVVIGCLVGIFLRIGLKGTQAAIESPENAMSCTFIITDAYAEYEGDLKEGDILYESTTGAKIGVVTSVTTTNAMKTVELLDGSLKRTENPARRDIRFTVDAFVMSQADGYYIEGTTFCAVGVRIGLTTGTFTSGATVIDMTVASQDSAS